MSVSLQKITVPVLLSAFEKQVKADHLSFIIANGYERDKNMVLNLTREILKLFSEAGENEENLNWSKCHEECTKLWKLLIRLALKDIDEESKGNARISEFQIEAARFEEVLYGLDPFYRDHILHSLWVYLLGDYLLRGQLKKIYKDLDWYLWNDVETDPDWVKLRPKAKLLEKELREAVDEKKDAIWCLIALCHDIGYPLSKLGEINRRVEEVLKYFDLRDFDQIGYNLKIEHQYLTKQFLELITVDVRIEGEPYTNEVVTKLYRDDGSYWRLCDSLERREHGTLSSFILYKLLGLFGDATLRGPAEEWGLDNEEAIDTLIRGMILYAIAQHELQYWWASELGSLADILLIADESEEFARWGRPVRTRRYLPTIAEVSLGFDFKGVGDNKEVGLKFEYDVHEQHDMSEFFERKIKRSTQLYHLKTPETGGRARIGRPRKSRFTKIASIDVSVRQKDSASPTLNFHWDRLNKSADLPENKGDTNTKTYELELIDDQLIVNIKGDTVLLSDWLKKE